MELLQVLDIDEALGCDDLCFHECQQIAAACNQFGSTPMRLEDMHGLNLGCGTHIFERPHHAPSFCDNTLSTRSGVSGRNGALTPIAFAAAVAMAAPGEITGGSPKPMTPRSS